MNHFETSRKKAPVSRFRNGGTTYRSADLASLSFQPENRDGPVDIGRSCTFELRRDGGDWFIKQQGTHGW
jgi:hypothetical protein